MLQQKLHRSKLTGANAEYSKEEKRLKLSETISINRKDNREKFDV